MYMFDSKQREAGLGSVNSISIAKAREIAAGMRESLALKVDPLDVRKSERKVKPVRLTFGESADALLASKESSWRNEKHRAQWRMTLETYAAPLRPLPAADVTTQDILRVLQPIWQEKPETASRLRGRIESVLDSARVAGHIGDREPNPARWSGHLEMLLPKPGKLSRGHHAAMPYQEIPGFMKRLAGQDSMAALALRFLVLTAARSGEVLGAKWNEFDLDARIWVVPLSRMKGGREHRVPLSGAALAIIQGLAKAKAGDFAFFGQKPSRPLSNMSLAMALRRMGSTVTPHGFRSSFRDWAGDATSFQREIAESALAHMIGDKAELAYRRGDALEKRRALMQAWADFCGPPR
jgi:integrase